MQFVIRRQDGRLAVRRYRNGVPVRSKPADVENGIEPQREQSYDSGLLRLPHELHLEIISYFPTQESHLMNERIVPHTLERRVTLTSLSQTCSFFRSFIMPFLWESIEVHRGMHTHKPRFRRAALPSQTHGEHGKAYANELLWQLAQPSINTTLKAYIRSINVLVPAYNAEYVLTELARCLADLPNIRKVNLNFAFDPRAHQDMVERVFSSYTYNQIREATVSYGARYFLPRCPNLTHLRTEGKWNMEYALMLECFSQMTVLDIPFQHRSYNLQFIADDMPNLREITLDYWALPKSKYRIELLTQLRFLQIIRIINVQSLPNVLESLKRPKTHRRAMERYGSRAVAILQEIWNRETKNSPVAAVLPSKMVILDTLLTGSPEVFYIPKRK